MAGWRNWQQTNSFSRNVRITVFIFSSIARLILFANTSYIEYRIQFFIKTTLTDSNMPNIKDINTLNAQTHIRSAVQFSTLNRSITKQHSEVNSSAHCYSQLVQCWAKQIHSKRNNQLQEKTSNYSHFQQYYSYMILQIIYAISE